MVTNVRAGWKISLIALQILVCSCTTMYRLRSAEDMAELWHEIVPLPDSLVVIPAFNGKDTIPIFSLKKHGGWEPLTIHTIYNDGKYEFLHGGVDILVSGYIEISELNEFFRRLNQMGFFGVTSESIKEKKYAQYKSVPWYSRYPAESGRTDMTTHTVDVALMNFRHHISQYDIGFYAKEYPTLQDLQILNECIIFIENFLAEKRIEVF